MKYIPGDETQWKDPCKDPCHKEHYLDKKHYPSQAYVGLKSSIGGAGPLTVPLGTLPINIASTSIDTRVKGPSDDGYPKRVDILLIFTATVSLLATAVASFNFQFVRKNSDFSTPIGPLYSFVKTVGAAAESTTIVFPFFDSGVDEDNYTYSIMLAGGSSLGTAGGSITNATLSAIGVS